MTRSLWVLFVIVIFISGCGSPFATDESIGSNLPLFRESTSQKFIPENDRVVSECGGAGDACLFLKNPVFQTQSLIAPDDASALQIQQRFQVHLTNIDKSGFLKNGQFDIQSTQKKRLSLNDVVQSHGFGASRPFVSAYYWLNRAHEYLTKNFESYPSQKRNIIIYVNDVFDGWVWSKHSLHLNEQKQSALSADVILALFGEAQAGFATDGDIYSASSTTHTLCGGSRQNCCKTSSGCSQALLHGVGNYFVAMLFDDDLGVGEFYAQNKEGQQICGKSRSPKAFQNMTFSQSFSLCASQAGNAMSMGLVYASIWSEVRSKFNPKVVDALFLKHLKNLSSTDTFLTAKEKIKDLCSSEGQIPIRQAFEDEFQRRL